jgi:hypothetical protein
VRTNSYSNSIGWRIVSKLPPLGCRGPAGAISFPGPHRPLLQRSAVFSGAPVLLPPIDALPSEPSNNVASNIAQAERILRLLNATQSVQFADLERLRRHASIRIPLGRTLTRGAGRPIDGGMALLSKKGESGTSRWDSLPGLRCPAWERKNQNE